jgi:hypothetical protein
MGVEEGMNTMNNKKRSFLSMVVLLLAVSLPFILSSGAAVQAESRSIAITMNEQPMELKHPPFLQNGAVYLPLRETVGMLNSRTTWFAEGKRIAVHHPAAHIEMKLSSKEATVNGRPYTLQASPKNVNGVVYVPVRFVSEALGAKVRWIPQEHRVDIGFDTKYLYAEKGTRGYWIDRKSGELFVSENGEAAKRVADTNVKIEEFGVLTIETLSPSVDLLKVTDNYGEPHLNDDIYKMVLAGGTLALETKVHYWGIHPIRNVEKTADGHVLLIDGATLYEVDETGTTVAIHDLRALTGYEDDAFQVEYYDDEVMAVRPHYTGWLTLIDRGTNKAVKLIDAFATEEQLKVYSEISGSDPGFAEWDGLTIVGREGDTLKLKHKWFLDGTAKDVSYDLNSNSK